MDKFGFGRLPILELEFDLDVCQMLGTDLGLGVFKSLRPLLTHNLSLSLNFFTDSNKIRNKFVIN